MSNVTVQEALNEAFEALLPFADCLQYIEIDEDDEEWAKFRLLIKNYRQAAIAYEKCKAALADIEKCEPVAMLRVNEFGEYGLYLKSDYKHLPIGEHDLFTSPQHRDWIVPSNEVIDTLWHKATYESVAHSEPFTRYRFSELLIKQLNTKG